MYIELIIILNFLLDFMILYGTKKILKINRSIKYLILGSIMGSITTIFLFIKISMISLIIIKIILSIIIIIISFGFKNIIRNIIYFYLISIILGGSIYLLDIRNIYLLIFISPIIIYFIIKESRNYKNKYSNIYEVNIYIKNEIYHLEGFIDTGNRLLSPIKKESIILVNLNIKTNKVLYIPYKALNSSGVIPCIRPDKIIINNKEINNCLIGLSKDKFYIDGLSCILPNKLKEVLC